MRCERHCVLRGERLVEVPHDLKKTTKTMRELVSVQDEVEDDEDEEKWRWVTHRLLHANSRSIGVVEGGGAWLVERRTRLHVEVSYLLQVGL